jgi:hypothetical protein
VKGIVLSFDPHLEIANLLVETYNRLWPDCRFQFRIPFTDRDPRSIFRAQNVEFISTPPDIRSTVENLLHDLPEDEFVFWCIDDRYPIEIFEPTVLRVAQDFASGPGIDIDSIKLTDLTVEGILGKLDMRQGMADRRTISLLRWLTRNWRRRHCLHSDAQRAENDKTWRQREEGATREPAFSLAGQPFFRQLGHPKNGFYMPQFITPAFLKRFFLAPALPLKYGIREFHHFLLSTKLEHKSYFPNKFLLSVGESTFRGRLSTVCYEQMLKFGVMPPKIEIVRDYKIYSDRDISGIVELNS